MKQTSGKDSNELYRLERKEIYKIWSRVINSENEKGENERFVMRTK